MKTKMLKLTLAAAAIAMIGFTARAQTDAARKDVKEAQKELKLAKEDSVADYKEFRNKAEAQIKENDKKIAELKAKKADEKKEVAEKYQKRVAELEKKNNALKKKIEESDKTKTDMWSSFKREFTHDMDELGRAIRDIGVDNAK